MRLLGISGSLSRGSRTSRVIQEVLDQAAQHEGIVVEMLEVSTSGAQFCDGRAPEKYDGQTRALIDKVSAGDCYVIGSPMYRGSYTGAFKNLFDLLPNDALASKVAGLVATGGSAHHFLALEHQLRPLLSFFRAYTVPGTVYAHNEHFTGAELDPAIREACRALADEVVRLAHMTSPGSGGPAYPLITRTADQNVPGTRG